MLMNRCLALAAHRPRWADDRHSGRWQCSRAARLPRQQRYRHRRCPPGMPIHVQPQHTSHSGMPPVALDLDRYPQSCRPRARQEQHCDLSATMRTSELQCLDRLPELRYWDCGWAHQDPVGCVAVCRGETGIGDELHVRWVYYRD